MILREPKSHIFLNSYLKTIPYQSVLVSRGVMDINSGSSTGSGEPVRSSRSTSHLISRDNLSIHLLPPLPRINRAGQEQSQVIRKIMLDSGIFINWFGPLVLQGDSWDCEVLRVMCAYICACLIFATFYLSLKSEIKSPQRHTDPKILML